MRGALALAALSLMAAASHAATFEVLHAFDVGDGGKWPWGGLVVDGAGVVYGTATLGGSSGAGTLFKLEGTTYTVLHAFTNDANDGGQPYGTLLLDAAGTLYGTTWTGGANGSGTVFSWTAAGGERMVHAFSPAEGRAIVGGVAQGTDGKLYGAASYGGAGDGGTIWKLDPVADKLTVLHTFTATEGLHPVATPTLVKQNVRASTTDVTGLPCVMTTAGAKFRLVDTGAPNGGSDFVASLTPDAKGNQWGVAARAPNGDSDHPGGVIYRIDPSGHYTAIYQFPINGSMGGAPTGTLLRRANGQMYGTTRYGGEHGEGTIFQFNPNTHAVTTVHSFTAQEGAEPVAGLAAGPDGALYGITTALGQHGGGSVYRFVP